MLPTLIYLVPLWNIKVGVWCASRATRKILPIVFWDHKSKPNYIDFDNSFEHLFDYEQIYDFVKQDSAGGHTADNPVLLTVFWVTA
jgi:hypothetical protein